jgi:hypothetical protein
MDIGKAKVVFDNAISEIKCTVYELMSLNE